MHALNNTFMSREREGVGAEGGRCRGGRCRGETWGIISELYCRWGGKSSKCVSHVVVGVLYVLATGKLSSLT